MRELVTPKMNNSNYFYWFGYRGIFSIMSTLFGNNTNIGISHGDELSFFFPLTFGPFKTSNYKFPIQDISVSELMVDLWTSFAANG